MPVIAALAGAAVPIACCVGLAFCVARAGGHGSGEDEDADAAAEAGRGGGAHRFCPDPPPSPSRTVAVIQPDGTACAAREEEMVQLEKDGRG